MLSSQNHALATIVVVCVLILMLMGVLYWIWWSLQTRPGKVITSTKHEYAKGTIQIFPGHMILVTAAHDPNIEMIFDFYDNPSSEKMYTVLAFEALDMLSRVKL